jgi:hypothetical protein
LPDVLAALAESPVLCPLAAAPEGTTVHCYRTAAGTEIDLLLEPPRGGHWAVEVKRSTAPAARGFHDVCCSGDGSPGEPLAPIS